MNGRVNIGWLIIMSLITFCLASNIQEPGTSNTHEPGAGSIQAPGTSDTHEPGTSNTQELGNSEDDQDRQDAQKQMAYICPGIHYSMASGEPDICNARCAHAKKVFWTPFEGYICFNKDVPAQVFKEIRVRDDFRECQCGLGPKLGISRSCVNIPHDIRVKRYGKHICREYSCKHATIFMHMEENLYELVWCHESTNLEDFKIIPTGGVVSGVVAERNKMMKYKCWCGVPRGMSMDVTNVSPPNNGTIYIKSHWGSRFSPYGGGRKRINPY